MLSDSLRTICWLYVFFVLIYTWLREIAIPRFLRDFAAYYMVYRFFWTLYLTLDTNENDSRLVFEIISITASFTIGILLLAGLKWVCSGKIKRKRQFERI